MKIGVVFGSRTTEHEVSVASAYGIMQGIIKNTQHEVFPLYITKQGKRVYEKEFLNGDNLKNLIQKNYEDTHLTIDFSCKGKFSATQKSSSFLGRSVSLELDVLFIILHGKNGEDGAVQGICQMLDVPYVSPGILGSALGINKVAMKDVLRSHDIPVVDYLSFFQGEENLDEIEKLGYPIFVKPANLGSSIGISKVTTRAELEQAVEVAFFYDRQIICEKGVSHLVELNCSLLVDKDTILTSAIEKITSKSDFLSFDEKYINEGGSMQGVESKVEIPAQIPESIQRKIYDLSKQVAKALHIDGGAPRIDFLWESDTEHVYVNEINTIPGAMQLHLWLASGYTFQSFVDTLIKTALFRKESLTAKSDSFTSSVIDITVNFKK